MAYEVTATKRRPQTFNDLMGQDFIVTTLRNSIQQGRIAHAYLFSGPRGVGKTSAARILAKALNCEQGLTENPCGICPACTEISNGNSLDVIEIDGASNTSVNDVREIKDEVLFSPNSCRYKIYIIDEVHMLSNSAFNALLKTIEEPPPYIVFIFATTEIHKVPATIRSRCQQYNFRLFTPELIKEMLGRVVADAGVEAEDQALFWIAKEATGSLRDAYTLLDQVISFSQGTITLEKIREKLGILSVEQINNIGDIIINGDIKQILEYADEVLNKGVSVEQFVIDLTEYFRSLLLIKTGITKDSLLPYPLDSYQQEIVAALTPEQLEKAIEMLLELYRNIRFSLNARYELELCMSRLMGLRRLITPAEILEQIQRMRGGGEPLFVEEAPAPMSSPAGDLWGQLLTTVRKQKLALAASLEKAAWRIDDDVLHLTFKAKDRYSGEHVQSEKEALLKTLDGMGADFQPRQIQVHFSESQAEGDRLNDQAEIIKRVFRGEIVKGE